MTSVTTQIYQHLHSPAYSVDIVTIDGWEFSGDISQAIELLQGYAEQGYSKVSIESEISYDFATSSVELKREREPTEEELREFERRRKRNAEDREERELEEYERLKGKFGNV